MSEFDIDSFFQRIEDFEREWREHREQELAKICEEHDFIVGSPELKLQLLEHLPNGANVVYSKYLDDPTMIIAIRKFRLSEYLMSMQFDFKEVEQG
jgi:hypothetical protein